MTGQNKTYMKKKKAGNRAIKIFYKYMITHCKAEDVFL